MFDNYATTRNPLTISPTGDDVNESENNWWRGAVIYQVYPRSFQDHNGDGIGDLMGITQRLEYIADLGVDAIWISPFFTSPMKDFGYDVSNYRDVDPIFGTMGDFDRLVEKAHGLGIRIIIDQVISHSSDQHPWFQESRQSKINAKSDWYVWADPKPDGSPPNNWLSIFGGSAWYWEPRRKQYYLHNFLSSQPDLNFHNAEVQSAVLEEMRFWLDKNVDGFRLDTVNFYFHSKGLENNPPLALDRMNAFIAPDVNPYNLQDHIFDKSRPENLEFLKKIRALLDEYPNVTSVGEIGDAQRQHEIMADYTTGSEHLHMAYAFDFLGGSFDVDNFRSAIVAAAASKDSWQCLAFSNHDVERHISRWAKHNKQDEFARLAAMLLLSMRGSVCLYQGEELGLTEANIAFEELMDPYGIEFWPKFKGRDGCRTPMVWEAHQNSGGFTTAQKSWLPVPADHLRRSVDQQEKSNTGSILEFYRAFIRFRKTQPALVCGDISLLDASDNILAFTRHTHSEKILCLFNMSARSATYQLPLGMNVQSINAPGSIDIGGTNHIELGGFEALVAKIV